MSSEITNSKKVGFACLISRKKEKRETFIKVKCITIL